MLKFLLPGNWSSENVSVHWTQSTRQIIPEVENAIDLAWEKALARPGINLFDGPMCRFESWTSSGSRLDLTLSRTGYKTFLGTNMANPRFAEQYGPNVLANPLGISTALLTADEKILLGRRTAAVAYHPSRVHPFAGCMEPDDAGPFTTASRELSEELSLNPTDITDLRCTGMVQDTGLFQPELTFIATSTLDQAQIESRLDPVEHHSIWSIPATAQAIETAVQTDKLLTPVAVAALSLYGRQKYGDTWFANLTANL
jgi:8-oxo-dGTP pyrophosphatase MutT (NUDIX family)